MKTTKAPTSPGHVEWLSSELAAVYLGFADPVTGAPKMTAFETWKARAKPQQHRLRGSLRFRRVDLDRCIEAEASHAK